MDDATSQSAKTAKGTGKEKTVDDVPVKVTPRKGAASRKCSIGFDLGGTKMLATVFDGDFNQIGRRRRRTRAFEGVDQSVQRIIETIYEVLEKAERTKDDLTCIGMGCPGPLDLDQGIVLEAPNLNFKKVRLRKLLQEEFGCPIHLLNDVDAGVYGEYRFGAGRGARCVLGVFPGTGIGGGCVYDGKILRGRENSCMEIGHTQVIPNGPLCGCGLRGCLEAVASRLAVSAAAAQFALRGQAPHLLNEVGSDVAEIRSSALSRSIKAGDKAIERCVLLSAEFVGVAVANVVHLLSPDVIVLGGGLVDAMPEQYAKAVLTSARARVLPSARDSFEVRVAELGDDSVVKGASAWAQRATV